MELRTYQREAVDAVWSHLCYQPGNPVVHLPTGSGKSLVIARLAEEAVQKGGRVIVTAHRKELLEQNADKIQRLAPSVDIGLYSAGLKARDTDHPVVVAGIQSVFKRSAEFGKRNLVIIDEAHLVPSDGDGMYQQFIAGLRETNSKVRLTGMTATPYRLDSGPICRPDGIFQRICYSAPIRELIDAGYLTRLVTSPVEHSVDTSGLRVRGGEFVLRDMQVAFSGTDVTEVACREIIEKTRDRKSVLVFCSGIEHADRAAETLERITGEAVEVVTGDTPPLMRASALERFAKRKLRFLVNCDVLTTGFDSPCIDAIAVLRATQSPGLFAQICGRGFRVYQEKEDCLVLDFGENIDRHGPLDSPEYGRCGKTGGVTGEAPMKECPNCKELVLAGSRECECGFIFPPRETSHDDVASEAKILSEPETFVVKNVDYRLHEKKNAPPGHPPTMRVIYTCVPEGVEGNLAVQQFSEYICIEHTGFANSKAVRWWQKRCLVEVPATVEEAVRIASAGAVAWPRKITAQKEGPFWRVLDADLEAPPRVDIDADEVFEDEPIDAFDAFEELPF